MKTNATRPRLNVERILPQLGRHQQPDEGIHQAILNIAYDRWQNTPGSSYSDMVNWMADDFGGIAKFAVLIGKFNQQVLNGGHSQYLRQRLLWASSGRDNLEARLQRSKLPASPRNGRVHAPELPQSDADRGQGIRNHPQVPCGRESNRGML